MPPGLLVWTTSKQLRLTVSSRLLCRPEASVRRATCPAIFVQRPTLKDTLVTHHLEDEQS